MSLAPSPGKLGIIAGMGDLPRAIAREARSAGYHITVFALRPLADESIKAEVDEFQSISIGKFGRLLNLLKTLNISQVVFAGKVPKDLLYKKKRDIIPDLKTLQLLLSIRDRSDDTIMKAVVEEIEKLGVKVRKTTDFARELLVPEGVLTRKSPTKEQWQDIEFGWEIAKKMGRLDIGQTVVVSQRAVMAVEAIEGTDEAIKRGGKLAGKGAVVVKVSKPQQDMRFDVPVVGLTTIDSMISSSSSVLAVEADRCLILERDKFIKKANRAGISVVGIRR